MSHTFGSHVDDPWQIYTFGVLNKSNTVFGTEALIGTFLLLLEHEPSKFSTVSTAALHQLISRLKLWKIADQMRRK